MRSNWLTAVTVGVVLAGAFTGPPAAAAPASQQPARPAPNPAAQNPAAMQAAFDAYMRAAVEHGQFSGTVLVAKDGVTLFRRSYGLASQELNVPNTDDTVYRLQSITKPFTALLIMMLQEEGRLRGDDLACKYLADCPAAWRTITT